MPGVMPMNRCMMRFWTATCTLCLAVSAYGCDFGVADGWSVAVPEKVEWRDVPFSNVVTALNGFIARYATNAPGASVQVVRESAGKVEIVPMSSPLFPDFRVSFAGRYIGIGCMVKMFAKIYGMSIWSTKHGPVFVMKELELEQQTGITNEFSGRVEPHR